jgi:flagellar basal-body rod protein FlgB
MESQGIFNSTTSMLGKVLDLRAFRNKLISSNIANLDTPNYQSFDVVMEKELGKIVSGSQGVELTKTQPGHLPNSESLSPKVIATAGILKADRNTVDIDRTMVDLAENGIMYNAAAEILNKKFQQLKSVIQGGGGQ